MFVPDETISYFKGVASSMKDHSRLISTATLETKTSATRARFSTMRIFYQKHYQRSYPTWLTKLVIAWIRFIEQLVLLKYYANWN